MNYNKEILSMENAVYNFLYTKHKDGFGFRKWYISEKTGLEMDFLTVVLKRLKNKGMIKIIMIWDERTGNPNGCGYTITTNQLKENNHGTR